MLNFEPVHHFFLIPQSRDYSCYVSRPILSPPPNWLRKHTDLRALSFFVTSA